MSDLIVTNADLWNAIVGENPQAPGPLVELAALDTPVKTSNRLRRALRLAKDAFADLDGARMALVTKYVTKADDGTEIIAPEFHEEFTALLAVEVPLAGVEAVKVDDLGDVKFAAAKLDRISKFVVEE